MHTYGLPWSAAMHVHLMQVWRPPQELIDSYSSGIEAVLGYKFQKRALLQEALTHTSWPDATQQVRGCSFCHASHLSFYHNVEKTLRNNLQIGDAGLWLPTQLTCIRTAKTGGVALRTVAERHSDCCPAWPVAESLATQHCMLPKKVIGKIMLFLTPCHAVLLRKRKRQDKTTPFSVNQMRNQVLNRAAHLCC